MNSKKAGPAVGVNYAVYLPLLRWRLLLGILPIAPTGLEFLQALPILSTPDRWSFNASIQGAVVSPELEFVRRETERRTSGVPSDALRQAPDGKWNSLQILEHLLLSYTATTKGLLRTMQAGQPERTERKFGHQLRSLYVLGLGRFPAGVEAPKHTVPGGGLGDEPLRRFNDALVAMDATLADAEKRFGAKTRVLLHPVLGPLTPQQWRRFHQVHGRHHLKQLAARVNGRA